MAKPVILAVDDDPQVLAAVRRDLRTHYAGDYQILAARCLARGVDFLCTPFHEDYVNPLAEMGVAAFKIASADLTNGPLLDAIRQTGLPVFLSTGASTLPEIYGAVFKTSQCPSCKQEFGAADGAG